MGRRGRRWETGWSPGDAGEAEEGRRDRDRGERLGDEGDGGDWEQTSAQGKGVTVRGSSRRYPGSWRKRPAWGREVRLWSERGVQRAGLGTQLWTETVGGQPGLEQAVERGASVVWGCDFICVRSGGGVPPHGGLPAAPRRPPPGGTRPQCWAAPPAADAGQAAFLWPCREKEPLVCAVRERRGPQTPPAPRGRLREGAARVAFVCAG